MKKYFIILSIFGIYVWFKNTHICFIFLTLENWIDFQLSLVGRLIQILECRLWIGSKPNLAHVCVFGSKVMAHVPKLKSKKWDAKAFEWVWRRYKSISSVGPEIEENHQESGMLPSWVKQKRNHRFPTACRLQPSKRTSIKLWKWRISWSHSWRDKLCASSPIIFKSARVTGVEAQRTGALPTSQVRFSLSE